MCLHTQSPLGIASTGVDGCLEMIEKAELSFGGSAFWLQKGRARAKRSLVVVSGRAWELFAFVRGQVVRGS